MNKANDIIVHKGDLPKDVCFGDSVAVDTETMGLQLGRDRLCLVQLSAGDGICHIVQVDKDDPAGKSSLLRKLLADQAVLKIFHFARFDLAAIKRYLDTDCGPLYCTRTASRLVRTYTDRHGLRQLCRELLNVDISKQQQCSDWGQDDLTAAQLQYAAGDVLYLHDLKKRLSAMLAREDRVDLAAACFDFLPHRVALDLAGWAEDDIFAHS